MNRKSKELKRIARETLNNRYHTPMTAYFLSTFILILIDMPFSFYLNNNPVFSQYIISYAAEFFISLIAVILSVGEIIIHLNMSREKTFTIGQLFAGFKEHPERFVGAKVLTMAISLGCCIPLIVGTIFFSYTPTTIVSYFILIITGLISLVLNLYFLLNYEMVYYFLIDYSNMKVKDAFRESRLLIKGQKGRLLYLHLSFLGWYLLILLSFGVASLWIMPYRNQTLVRFYSDLTGELDRRQVNFTDTTI